MSLGSDTQVVNGQRFVFPTSASYNPLSYGLQTNGVPNVSPSMPPFVGQQVGSVGGVNESVGGYGTAANNTAVTSLANQNPHNLKVSPVWWAVIVLLIGLFLLRHIHWRETVLEGAEERGHVGGARESASEEA